MILALKPRAALPFKAVALPQFTSIGSCTMADPEVRMSHIFNAGDAGCYADGCLGHQHIRAVLADMIESAPTAIPLRAELAAELRGPMSDDASEEYEAIELLNLLCAPDVRFEMQDGDLVLVWDDPTLWEGDY